MAGTGALLSTLLLQEHLRERSPLVSPLYLGHHRRDRTLSADPSWRQQAGGGEGAVLQMRRNLLAEVYCFSASFLVHFSSVA